MLCPACNSEMLTLAGHTRCADSWCSVCGVVVYSHSNGNGRGDLVLVPGSFVSQAEFDQKVAQQKKDNPLSFVL